MAAFWRPTPLFAVLALALPAAGCGPSATDYCDTYCDCANCSARGYDECLDNFDLEERRASRRGCSPEFEDAVACVVDVGVCNRLISDCLRELGDYNRCMN